MTRELIFVDTETSGFDSDPNSVLVELTWARLSGDPQTLWFGVEEVPAVVDDLIGFTKRGIAGRQSPDADIQRFLDVSAGNTMVAANPAFDKHFIRKADLWRFHYRMLDIEAYAMRALDLNEVPSMKDIQEALTGMGFTITEPDHTSRNDVLSMRDSYQILKRLRAPSRVTVSP